MEIGYILLVCTTTATATAYLVAKWMCIQFLDRLEKVEREYVDKIYSISRSIIDRQYRIELEKGEDNGKVGR